MSRAVQVPSYEYVAYIDEAGDLGLGALAARGVRTGASEWFVLAGVVVSRANEMNVRTWHQEMLEATRGKQLAGQRQTLHFRDLNEVHKSFVCETLASKPMRCFVVCSHKKSLTTWRPTNNLVRMNNRDWYYNSMSR